MTRRNLTNDLTQLFLSLGPCLFCRAAQEWVGVGGTLHFQRLKTQSSSNTSLWGFCLSGSCWFFEIRSRYVTQAGFKLRLSSGLSLLSAGILHYHTWLHPHAHFFSLAFPFFLL